MECFCSVESVKSFKWTHGPIDSATTATFLGASFLCEECVFVVVVVVVATVLLRTFSVCFLVRVHAEREDVYKDNSKKPLEMKGRNIFAHTDLSC